MFGAKKPDFSALGQSFIDKMSKGTGTSIATTGGGSNALVKQDVSPLATMKDMFADMRDSLQSIQNNTLETVELLKTAVMGDPAQNKKDKIKAGDVDRDEGPGILSRAAGGIKSAVSSLIPEKGGLMDTLLKLGLAVGGIALLKVFGPSMVGPLGNLIKAFKEGKLGEKIGEIVTDIQEYLAPFWDKIKIKTGEFIDGVKLVFGLIMGAAKAVNDYIMSFDTQGKIVEGGPLKGTVLGDGKLDDEEKQNMIKDVTTRISEAIMGFVGNIGSIIIDGFLLYAIGSTALKLIMKRGAVAAGASMFLAGGVFSMALAAVAIGAGIFKLANNTMTAYNAAVTDELGNPQKFAMNEFATTLLVGAETGNELKDVMKNAADKAIIGGSIGFVIGGPLGAAVGALAGGLVGGFATYLGGPKVQQMIDGAFGENSIIGSTVNALVDTYKLLILNPFEYLFGKLGKENDSFMSRMGFQFDKMSGKPLTKEDRYGKNVNKEILQEKSTTELMSILNDNIKLAGELKQTRKLVNVPFFGPLKIGAFDKQLTGDQQNDLTGYKLIIKRAEKELLERGIDLRFGAADIQTQELNLEKIKNKKILDDAIDRGLGTLRPDGSYVIPSIDGPTIIPINNDSSVKTQTSTSVYGGLGINNPNITAETINQQYLVRN